MAIYETRNSAAGFQKTFYRHNRNLTFHAHLHNSFELLRVTEGEIDVQIEKQIYRLRKGEQILILPNLIHSYQTENKSVTQFVIFSTDYLPEIDAEAKSGRFRQPVLAPESDEVFDLLLKHRREHFLFRSALYRIADLYEANEAVSLFVKRNSEFTLWLSDYLEAHLTESLDEGGVAKEMGYHPRYLSTLINRNFGVSFQGLLSEYRIRLAAKLLADREKSITEVYTMAGFESQCSFNRNFKRIMGVTPREYRATTHGEAVGRMTQK